MKDYLPTTSKAVLEVVCIRRRLLAYAVRRVVSQYNPSRGPRKNRIDFHLQHGREVLAKLGFIIPLHDESG